MSKINLIPEVKQKKQKIQKVNATVTSVVTVVSVVVGLLLLGILSYNGVLLTQNSSTNKKIAKIEENIKTMKDLEEQVATLEFGLKNIRQITDQGKSWTKFFGEIEKATPADVQLVSFNIDGNQVSASMRGKEIRSIDRFIASFDSYENEEKQKLFSNIVVEGYSLDENSGGYVFDAKFEVNEEAAW